MGISVSCPCRAGACEKIQECFSVSRVDEYITGAVGNKILLCLAQRNFFGNPYNMFCRECFEAYVHCAMLHFHGFLRGCLKFEKISIRCQGVVIVHNSVAERDDKENLPDFVGEIYAKAEESKQI